MQIPPSQTPRLARTAFVTLLGLGCVLVLLPFLPAMLFAAVICTTTWPVYRRLRARVGNREFLSASVMTAALVCVVLIPVALLAATVADNVAGIGEAIQTAVSKGPPAPPEWIKALPMIGESVDRYWHRLIENREELARLGQQAIEPARKLLFAAGALLGQGLLQITLVLFVAFFFYRDGETLADALRTSFQRLVGDMGDQLFALTHGTVNGVMFGLVGTAFAQAVVAVIGFLIAGVPAAFVLATATFFLSLVPVGPPLIWGGAAVWLYQQGEIGWCVFMVLWGLLVISSVDNFLKPILISRSSSMPIMLIFLGVFGGALAFGFVGIFLGPLLLALGFALAKVWTQRAALAPSAADGTTEEATQSAAPRAPDTTPRV
jgi:predicted PurR-regulated permease PerM